MQPKEITAGLCYRSHLAGLTSEVTAIETIGGRDFVRHHMYADGQPFGEHLTPLKKYADWCTAVAPHPIYRTKEAGA